MDKDAFYFPHFCNARHDRKIQRLRLELGVEGYGIFFMLLEVLRDQTDFSYPLDDIQLLSKEFDTSEQKVRTVICNYNLFEVDTKNNFFSPKMLVYLEPFFAMKNQRKQAAISRWAKKKCGRIAGEMQSKQSKVNKVKESKEKEFVPPTAEEIEEYGRQLGYKLDGRRIVEYYNSNNWMDSKNKPVNNWKMKVNSVWCKEECRIKEPIQAAPAADDINKIIDIYYTQLKHGMMTVEQFTEHYKAGKIPQEVYNTCLNSLKTITANNQR